MEYTVFGILQNTVRWNTENTVKAVKHKKLPLIKKFKLIKHPVISDLFAPLANLTLGSFWDQNIISAIECLLKSNFLSKQKFEL